MVSRNISKLKHGHDNDFGPGILGKFILFFPDICGRRVSVRRVQ